jgi:uncharacterized protein (DUF433 family)
MTMNAAQHHEFEEVAVSAPAAAAVDRAGPPVHSDPEIMSGTPVFVGTRVPVETMFDYLEGGHNLSEFLDDFPSVERAQALATLEIARREVLRLSARTR